MAGKPVIKTHFNETEVAEAVQRMWDIENRFTLLERDMAKLRVQIEQLEAQLTQKPAEQGSR